MHDQHADMRTQLRPSHKIFRGQIQERGDDDDCQITPLKNSQDLDSVVLGTALPCPNLCFAHDDHTMIDLLALLHKLQYAKVLSGSLDRQGWLTWAGPSGHLVQQGAVCAVGDVHVAGYGPAYPGATCHGAQHNIGSSPLIGCTAAELYKVAAGCGDATGQLIVCEIESRHGLS